MFETALVESAGLLRTHNRKPAMISITAQCVAVAVIVLVPLLHPEVISHRLDVLHAITMPTMPAPVPPPPVHVRMIPTVQPTVQPVTTAPSAPSTPQPPVIHASAPITDTPPTAPLTLGTSMSTGPALPIGPATSGPNIAVAHSGTGTGPGTGTGVGTGNSTAKSVNISSGVSVGLLMAPIQPIYPAIARAAHQSGTVLVEATISPTGRVESVHAISGPATLQGAAVDAVRAARYHPFLLNGQPTEVNASFSIHFSLNE